ncbi:MAG TPA: 3-deoxy-D-manno-octulosonic acid transferase, partial [Deltaproteobacteria bacterium]|nr:3-deoxy-D-manno-octulosonic acid transferase [Deltaproteobacteria bacterium]
MKNQRLRERFALDSNFPLPAKSNIWIHALSVGEVISALPLVDALQTKYSDQGVVFTVTTKSGMTVAEEKLKNRGIRLQYMPLDAWWILRKFVRHIRPSVFVLVETDIWPGLLDWLQRKGVRSILVNGRISPRTFRAYNKARFFVRKVFDPLELCLMQSDLDRNRLLRIGIPERKVMTTGNIKFDRKWVAMSRKEREEWSYRLKIKPGTFLWVAGSTHPGEEEIVLDVFMRIRASFPDFRLILAPRDIGRSREIMEMVSKRDLKWVLRSRLSAGEGAEWDVLVLDTMGELGRIYGLAGVSFVGGSLVRVGGHNLLEPASFGCPILFGPYTHNFV